MIDKKPKLTKTEEYVLSQLPVGRDNAKYKEEIAHSLGISTDGLRSHIRRLIDKYVPICSIGGGYFIATCPKDLDDDWDYRNFVYKNPQQRRMDKIAKIREMMYGKRPEEDVKAKQRLHSRRFKNGIQGTKEEQLHSDEQSSSEG